MSKLFRADAVAHSTRRLAGDVMLATPLPARLVGFVLAGIVLAATVFAGVANYARKANVTGWLVPDQGLIRATAPAAGLMQAVLVSEGEVVERGQRLAEVALATETAAGNAGEVQARALRQEAVALKARGAATIAKLEAEAELTRTRLDNLRRELKEIEAQAALQQHRVQLAESQVAIIEPLAAKGMVSLRELEQRRSAALASQQELAALRRQIVRIERELAEGAGRLAAIPIELDGARADALSADATLQQRTSEAEARSAIVVVAPIGGRIAALPVAAGQPVTAGGTLAIVTPVDGKLEAELLAPSRAIGFIRPGQEVRLQLQAFPYQRFGTVAGTVRSVSSTVLGPTEIAIPGLTIQEPVFRVRVALVREVIE